MTTKEPSRLEELNIDPYLMECLETDPLNLEIELSRLPSDYAYWSELFTRALSAMLMAHLKTKRVAAKLRVELREVLEAQRGKATESMVDSAVTAHTDMQDAENEELSAEVEKVRLGGVVEAMRTRREVLSSLAANMRKEMDRDPEVAAQYAMRNGR